MPYDDAAKPDQSEQDIQSAWMTKIEAAEKAQRQFREFVKRVNNRLRIKDADQTVSRGRGLNIAWANLEILKPSTFARPPKVVVATRNDSRDPVVSAAAALLEKAANTNNDLAGNFDALLNVRDDYLRYARGVVWIRYEGTIEEYEMDQPEPSAEGAAMPAPSGEMARGMGDNGGPPMDRRERLTDERVYIDFVSWDKFGHNPAQTWNEVEFVYRLVPMTKDAFKKRWPKRVNEVTFGPAKSGEDKDQRADNTAIIIECWCKESRKVYWLCKQCKTPLEIGPPPIDFRNFWPCPKPAFGSTLDRTLKPKPDLMFYEDQLTEIDDLTKRIGALQQSLKVKGFYSQGASKDGAAAIEAAMLSNEDRQLLVPVSGWAAMGDKKDMGIVWLPVDMVSRVLTDCVALRKEMIQNVYEVTGISDIMRGSSEASETLGAQQLKSQYGSVRVREKQAEMARIARDSCAMVGEVIAEHFEQQTLEQMTATQVPPEVMALMRSDKMRNFMVDIETDSTIVPDENMEKQRRVEFATTVGGMIQQAAPIAQQSPPLAMLVAEVIKYVAQGFRAGRPLEQAIDDAMKGTVQQISARAQQPPPPDPKMLQIEVSAQADDKRLAFEEKKHADTMALDERKMLAEMEFKRECAERDHGLKRDDMQRRYDEAKAMRQPVADLADEAHGRTAKQAGDLVAQMTPTLQSVGEGLAAVGQGLAAVGAEVRAGQDAVAQAMSAVAEALMADAVPVRGPDGKMAAVRKVKPQPMVT